MYIVGTKLTMTNKKGDSVQVNSTILYPYFPLKDLVGRWLKFLPTKEKDTIMVVNTIISHNEKLWKLVRNKELQLIKLAYFKKPRQI